MCSADGSPSPPPFAKTTKVKKASEDEPRFLNSEVYKDKSKLGLAYVNLKGYYLAT